MSTEYPRWADRPGPVGSLQERTYYEQLGGIKPDTVAQIKAILRSRMDVPVQINLLHETAEDGTPEMITEMISRLEIANAVSRLPHPIHRWGLTLVYERGLPQGEVAFKLRISVRTLQRYLAEALELVADMVCEYVRERQEKHKPCSR